MKTRRWLTALLVAALLAGCGGQATDTASSASASGRPAASAAFEKKEPGQTDEVPENTGLPVPADTSDYSAWLALGWQAPTAEELGHTGWAIYSDANQRGASLDLSRSGYVRMNTWAEEGDDLAMETDEGLWSLREENGETLLCFRLYLGDVAYTEAGPDRELLEFEMPVLFLPEAHYAVLLDAGQDPGWFMGGYWEPDGSYILLTQEQDEAYFPYYMAYGSMNDSGLTYLTIEVEDQHDEGNGFAADYQTFALPDPLEYPGLYAILQSYNSRVAETAKEAGTTHSRRIEILRSDSQVFSFAETFTLNREFFYPYTYAAGGGTNLPLDAVVYDLDQLKEEVISALNAHPGVTMTEGWEDRFRAKEADSIPFALDETGIWVFVSGDDVAKPTRENQRVRIEADPEFVDLTWFPAMGAVG